MIFFTVLYCYYQVRSRINALTLERKSRVNRISFGKYLNQSITIRNLSGKSIRNIEVEDLSTLPGSFGSRVIDILAKDEVVNYSWNTLLIQRGFFKLRPTQLSISDPFGMFKIEKYLDNQLELMVYPPVLDVKIPKPFGGIQNGKILSRLQSRKVSPQAAGIREYSVGDDLNHIHWPYSAKKNALMVKEFDQDNQETSWIILDSEKYSHYAIEREISFKPGVAFDALKRSKNEIFLPEKTIEYAVSYAASVANALTTQSISCGFCSSTKDWILISAEKGQRQFQKIIQILSFIQPEGSITLAALTSRCKEQIKPGSTSFFITTRSDDELLAADQIMRKKRISCVFYIINPEPFGGPALNKVNINFLRKHNTLINVIQPATMQKI